MKKGADNSKCRKACAFRRKAVSEITVHPKKNWKVRITRQAIKAGQRNKQFFFG
jgi:hypothetical protein